MYSIEMIDRFDQFTKLEESWNKLISTGSNEVPFTTFEWFYSWWKAFGEKNNMLILIIKEGDDVVAIAPFMKTSVKLCMIPVSAISFMDSFHAGRMGIIMNADKPEIMRLLLSYLRTHHAAHNVLLFNPIEKNSLTDRIIKTALNRENFMLKEAKSDFSPYIPISGTWEQYLGGRSRNFRHKLNRISNLFIKTGGYEIVLSTTPAGLDDVFDISRRTWKYGEKTAIANNPLNMRFYRILAQTMAEKNWLKIWVLKLRGKPIAFQYALDYKNRIFGLKIGFDQAYEKLSPSKFLAKHIIQYCFEKGYAEFDMIGKNDSYKMDWTNSIREHYKYIIFNDNIFGKALHSLTTKIIPGIKSILSPSEQRATDGS